MSLDLETRLTDLQSQITAASKNTSDTTSTATLTALLEAQDLAQAGVDKLKTVSSACETTETRIRNLPASRNENPDHLTASIQMALAELRKSETVTKLLEQAEQCHGQGLRLLQGAMEIERSENSSSAPSRMNNFNLDGTGLCQDDVPALTDDDDGSDSSSGLESDTDTE